MSILQNFVKQCLPSVKAGDEEAELVDPQKVLREECGAQQKCASLQERLNTCNDRVNSRTQTAETCLEEVFDFVNCVDHCVAKTLFTKLK